MQRLFLLSPIDALVKTQNEEITLISNIPHEIETLEENLMFFPINTPKKHYLPCCICTNRTRPDNLTKIKIKNSTLLEISPYKIVPNQTFTEKINGKTLKIHCGNPSFIILENDDLLFMKEIQQNLSLPKVQKTSCGILISADVDSRKFFLAIGNDNTELACDLVDEISISDNQITTIKYFFDMAKQGILTTYELPSFSKKEELIYEKPPRIVDQPELIPFAFFEAIKAKNFSLSKQYLSSQLRERLDDEHLEQFFGDFDCIYINVFEQTPNKSVCLIYRNKKIGKIFTLEILNNKINNISEYSDD